MSFKRSVMNSCLQKKYIHFLAKCQWMCIFVESFVRFLFRNRTTRVFLLSSELIFSRFPHRIWSVFTPIFIPKTIFIKPLHPFTVKDKIFIYNYFRVKERSFTLLHRSFTRLKQIPVTDLRERIKSAVSNPKKSLNIPFFIP